LSAVITITDLGKSYGTNRVLDGVSVEFPGGAMGLLGPNGAGKTTLLKTLLGLLRSDRGRAEVLGLDAARSPLELRRRIGYMPETDCYIPGMKGIRLTTFAGELAGLPAKSALSRAHEVLFYAGLGEARYRLVEEYSQGMRQRLRLAQALVHDPDLLFLDEPTSGLDPAGRREMLDLVKDLAGPQGKHVILSSHLLPDVEEVCKFAVVLNRGRIAAAGPLEDLRDHEEGFFEARVVGDIDDVARRLKEGGIEVVGPKDGRLTVCLREGTMPLFVAARDAGAQVRELREVASTLEDAFLHALDPDGFGGGN
jgi:ABC-2 type transport system ATP-binding protein